MLAVVTSVSAQIKVGAAVAGTTNVGTTISGLKSGIWQDWYADPIFSPHYSVNGALINISNWTGVSGIPVSGVAKYSGNVVGKEQSDNIYNVTGEVDLSADFAQRRITAGFKNLKRSDGNSIGRSGASSTASFNLVWRGGSYVIAPTKNTSGVDLAWGQVRMGAMTGEAQARFYDGTKGVAGVWYLSGSTPSSLKTMVSGTFAANVVTPAPVTSAFSSWAGTAPAGAILPARSLTPDNYSPNTKQALYVGKVDATLVNQHATVNSSSNVTGNVQVAVNFGTYSVNGKIGQFEGSSEAANFLNNGTVTASAKLDSGNKSKFTGDAVWTPTSAKTSTAIGTFAGQTNTSFVKSTAGTVPVAGNLAQGTFNVKNADFVLSGNWRANLTAGGK